jgi:dTMP kinase
MPRGTFFVFEGIDGSGTTTHAKHLVAFLNERGIDAHLTAEPSQGSVGRFLRQALKDKTLDPYTDALLFAADRIEHTTKEILPKLEEGYVVISDRYLLSSVCYQSAKSDVPPEWIFEINQKAMEPDLTIIFDVDPRDSMARIADREEFEKFENVPFLDAVRANYKKYVNPPKVVEIDSTGSIDETFAHILTLSAEVLGCDLS